MHLRHVEAGVIGTNAIVGGGVYPATGAALAQKLRGTGNVVVCFFGDGAANQGTFHESANMAGIWDLPIIYFIENNHYAVATCASDSCAVSDLSLRAVSYGMDGYIVDGMDPVAVHSAVAEATGRVRDGGKPCIIEAKCYRRYHHAGGRPGSAFGYRSVEEESSWLKREGVAAYPDRAVRAGAIDESGVKRIQETARELMACTVSGSPRIVRPELQPKPESVTDGLRSRGAEWRGITFSGPDNFGEFEEIRYSDAIAAVTGRWLEKDSGAFVMGEEVANFGGGAYGATRGLPSKYPDRVLNTPISESGFVGMACGAALTGLKPIVEIMFGDFALVSADQLFSQIAKTRHMYGGETDVPLVARTRVGIGYGGQHSMDPVALFAMFPGWRVVYPSNAFDYIGLFNSAMVSLDPVLIIEHHSFYNRKFPVPKANRDYFTEMGKAGVVREGDHVTVITYGSMVSRCVEIAERILENGLSAEVIDMRTVDFPGIDYDTIEIMGRESGYCKGKGGSMHIADPSLGIIGANGIVGAGIPIAAGAGLWLQLSGCDSVVACFFGDSASNQGMFHEGINLASLWHLPVVFICENVHRALTVAEKLAKEGIEVEVVDPRTLVPMDCETLYRSVRKTGRLVIMDEGCLTGGVAAKIATRVGRECFDYLDAPIERVCATDTPVPFSPPLEAPGG